MDEYRLNLLLIRCKLHGFVNTKRNAGKTVNNNRSCESLSHSLLFALVLAFAVLDILHDRRNVLFFHLNTKKILNNYYYFFKNQH